MNCTALAIFMLIAAAGIICFLLYSAIGATIDGDGILHEPFALIPVGYALLAVGLGGAAVVAVIGWARQRHTHNRHPRA